MATIEEELKMIKTAHHRLLNQHKELEKVVLDLINTQKGLNQYVQEQLIQMSNTQPPKVKNPLVIDNIYREQISEIISTNQVEWQGGQYVSYEIKFNDREEIYTCFISLKYRLLAGFTIRFTYDGNGKLKQLRILE
jgi:hypothetical protein